MRLRAPARAQGARRSTRRCAGSGGSTGFELEPIEPAVAEWRYRNKLEYSLRRATTASSLLGFHRRGSWVGDRGRATTASSPRRRTTRPATRSATGRRGRVSPPTTARAETGVLRNLVVREGRRTGPVQTRLVTAPGEIPRPPRRPAHGDRGPSRGHRRPDRRARRRAHHGGALRPALPRLAQRLPADQHGDGRAPVRARRRATPASSGSERLFDLFCGIGTIGLVAGRRRRRGLGRRGRGGRGRRRRATTPR